jgi:excinuclease ABC subunit C
LLLEHFKSIEKIKKADVDDLKEVKGIDSGTAQAIYRHFNEIKESKNRDKNKEEEKL